MKYYCLLVLVIIEPYADAEPTRNRRQSAVSPPQPGCFPAACPQDCGIQFFNDPQTGCSSCRCDPNDNSNPFFSGQFGIPTPAPPITTVSTCTQGDIWTDKCNSCFCSPSGVPSCTLRDCTNAPPGPACRPGDNWSQDCNRCTCLNNQPVCSFKGCPAVERCTEGQTKRSDDGCNTCKCTNGVFACTRRACIAQGRPVCNPNTPCPADCPAGTIVTTDSQTGCQKCICRLTLGRPNPAGICNPRPPCPLDCPFGTAFVTNPQTGCRSCTCGTSTGIGGGPTPSGICNPKPPCPLDCPFGPTFVTNPQTGCRSCTCGTSTGIGGGPTPSLVCNPNPPCPSDCATEYVIEPLTRCRSCRCQPGSPTITRPQPDRCPPLNCPQDCATAIVQNPQNGCNICTCNSNTQINPFASPPSPVNACQPYQCPPKTPNCNPLLNRHPVTGCQTCTCANGFNPIFFGNLFGG